MMWENTIPVIVGGLLAIGGGIGTQCAIFYLKNRQTRRAIAGALAGEIGAICSIVRRRNYSKVCQDYIKYIEETGEPQSIVMKLTQDYLTIYHSNANEIGLLPPEQALEVARFYTQVKAMMEDIQPDAPKPRDSEEAVAKVRGLLDLLTATLILGDELFETLAKEAQGDITN